MKTFKVALLIISLSLTLACLPVQANRQEKTQQAPMPCPTPVVYSMLEAKPKILHKDAAIYTIKARDEKIQGTVVLQAVFHESGKVTDIIVIRGLPYGLTEQAIGTAYMIKFAPAVKDGRLVSVRGNLEYAFKLY